MNKDKLTALCHKIASETGVTFNSVLTYYFLENVLKMLSKSSYKDRLIFKGGYILSNIVGLDSRSTIDIDLLFKDASLSKNDVHMMFESTLKHNEYTNIDFELYDVDEIKKEDNYGGYRVRIVCKLENIRQVVPIDIGTGDLVTYQPVDYEYITLFLNENLNIKSYNLETMLAEKLETIYSKGFLNSRSKDFYDVHILFRLKKSEIDFNRLRVACERTFLHRATTLNFSNLKDLIIALSKDKGFYDRWEAYTRKNTYASDTKLLDVINSIYLLVDEIEKVQNSREGS
ncbi:MAG: nucleotidyl transferase AbiEii/AbiGii toxin family protein [Erysipelothrix sp.]|jgi:predicted nucleotidyltransferase component of viral defense system|nr:nucleotidyl transferase AbiEii/AbiGii toxin family protein [Erysipelothrix sp.]